MATRPAENPGEGASTSFAAGVGGFLSGLASDAVDAAKDAVADKAHSFVISQLERLGLGPPDEDSGSLSNIQESPAEDAPDDADEDGSEGGLSAQRVKLGRKGLGVMFSNVCNSMVCCKGINCCTKTVTIYQPQTPSSSQTDKMVLNRRVIPAQVMDELDEHVLERNRKTNEAFQMYLMRKFPKDFVFIFDSAIATLSETDRAFWDSWTPISEKYLPTSKGETLINAMKTVQKVLAFGRTQMMREQVRELTDGNFERYENYVHKGKELRKDRERRTNSSRQKHKLTASGSGLSSSRRLSKASVGRISSTGSGSAGQSRSGSPPRSQGPDSPDRASSLGSGAGVGAIEGRGLDGLDESRDSVYFDATSAPLHQQAAVAAAPAESMASVPMDLGRFVDREQQTATEAIELDAIQQRRRSYEEAVKEGHAMVITQDEIMVAVCTEDGTNRLVKFDRSRLVKDVRKIVDCKKEIASQIVETAEEIIVEKASVASGGIITTQTIFNAMAEAIARHKKHVKIRESSRDRSFAETVSRLYNEMGSTLRIIDIPPESFAQIVQEMKRGKMPFKF